jgi:hypothetical protein
VTDTRPIPIDARQIHCAANVFTEPTGRQICVSRFMLECDSDSIEIARKALSEAARAARMHEGYDRSETAIEVVILADKTFIVATFLDIERAAD